MISSIKGRISDLNSSSLTVEIGGIGVQVFVPIQIISQLNKADFVELHTYLAVREDSLTLYGFLTKEDKEYFIMLLGVNGVGPRLALAGISTLNPDAIRRAVFTEQPGIFSQIPGVGKKTAQKIYFHIQDKVKSVEAIEKTVTFDNTDSQVVDALINLGYSVVEAHAALQAIPKDTPDAVESRILAALAYFSS